MSLQIIILKLPQHAPGAFEIMHYMKGNATSKINANHSVILIGYITKGKSKGYGYKDGFELYLSISHHKHWVKVVFLWLYMLVSCGMYHQISDINAPNLKT